MTRACRLQSVHCACPAAGPTMPAPDGAVERTHDRHSPPPPAPPRRPPSPWTQALEQPRALDPLVSLLRPVRGLVRVRPRPPRPAAGRLARPRRPSAADRRADRVVHLGADPRPDRRQGGSARGATAHRARGCSPRVPTFWTGWAEWAELEQRDQRVGVVHASDERHGGGRLRRLLAGPAQGPARSRASRWRFASAGLMGAAGYLGGHLVSARKASTHHPAFD